MTRLILHIGAHKTATTYIQKALSDNFKFFTDNGVMYLKSGREFLWGHHKLVEKICDINFDPQKLINEIKLESSQSRDIHTIVISSESLESISQEAINKLKALEDEFEIEIVYFWRSFQSNAYSSWQESVKHGSKVSFKSYVLSNLITPYQSDLINFNNILIKYEKTFPNAKFNIFSYDEIKNKKINILEFFSRNILNIKLQSKDLNIPEKEINTSFTPEDVEFIRALNSYIDNNYNFKNGNTVREEYVNQKTTSKINISKINFIDFKETLSIKGNNPVINNVLSYIQHKKPNYFSSHNSFTTEIKNHDFSVINPDVWLKKENYSFLESTAKIIMKNINKQNSK